MCLKKMPENFLAAGLDGKVYLHQLNFTQMNENLHQNLNNQNEEKDLPPKWYGKKTGLTFGFGGKFLTFSDKTNPIINHHKLLNNQELSKRVKNFVEKSDDLNELLDHKISTITDKSNNLMWVALKCYYKNDYDKLFTALGYDKESIKTESYNFVGKKVAKANVAKTREFTNLNANKNKQGKDALSFFGELTNKAETKKENPKNENNNNNNSQVMNNTEKPNLITETISRNINWNQGSEKLIKQSLLTGDLESSVEVAMKSGREAEAILIAVSSGNQELINKTKNEYFSRNKDLFIRNIFSSIINKNFESLLDYNVIKEWKEYILYAKTYLNDAKFASFAYSIGEKLSNNDDIYSAIVCFILGQNYSECINLLYNKYLKDIENSNNKTERQYHLHNLFEEMMPLKYILSGGQNNNEISDIILNEYSNLLIENNLFEEACRYINKIRNKSEKNIMIYDKIYGHCENTLSKLFPKLAIPYNVVNVKSRIQVNNNNRNQQHQKSNFNWDNNSNANTNTNMQNQNQQKNRVPPSNHNNQDLNNNMNNMNLNSQSNNNMQNPNLNSNKNNAVTRNNPPTISRPNINITKPNVNPAFNNNNMINNQNRENLNSLGGNTNNDNQRIITNNPPMTNANSNTNFNANANSNSNPNNNLNPNTNRANVLRSVNPPNPKIPMPNMNNLNNLNQNANTTHQEINNNNSNNFDNRQPSVNTAPQMNRPSVTSKKIR
jgi:hypothetical protein